MAVPMPIGMRALHSIIELSAVPLLVLKQHQGILSNAHVLLVDGGVAHSKVELTVECTPIQSSWFKSCPGQPSLSALRGR